MITDEIQVIPFSDNYQADVTEFMDTIEREFAEPISHSNPATKKMTEVANFPRKNIGLQ